MILDVALRSEDLLREMSAHLVRPSSIWEEAYPLTVREADINYRPDIKRRSSKQQLAFLTSGYNISSHNNR